MICNELNIQHREFVRFSNWEEFLGQNFFEFNLDSKQVRFKTENADEFLKNLIANLFEVYNLQTNVNQKSQYCPWRRLMLHN